jgi:hypothetical protein
MRLTRWKLMAGVLGLSMCGLAALAEPACRSVGLTRRADEPKPEEKPVEAAKPLPLPLPVAPPPTTEVPPAVIPVFEDKKSDPLPKPVEVKAVPMPEKNDPKLPPAVDFKLLEDVHKTQSPPIPLPTINKDEPKKVEAMPLPVPTRATFREPLPAPVPAALGTPTPDPVKVDTQPIPVPAPTPIGIPQPVAVPAQAPPPVDLLPVKNEKAATAPLPEPKKADSLPPPSPIVPAPDAPKPAGAVSNKKLKVTLHLSDEKPWFEVKDGDEVVLKVTADGVQLVAIAEKRSDKPSTLVAVGGVTFRTLGGYGTCDELQVVPGTGEVVVTGKVTVTSNWGKAETTATADKMTFRLGGDAAKK